MRVWVCVCVRVCVSYNVRVQCVESSRVFLCAHPQLGKVRECGTVTAHEH